MEQTKPFSAQPTSLKGSPKKRVYICAGRFLPALRSAGQEAGNKEHPMILIKIIINGVLNKAGLECPATPWDDRLCFANLSEHS